MKCRFINKSKSSDVYIHLLNKTRKLIRPVIQYFRQTHNLRIISYVDDFVIGDNKDNTEDSAKLVLDTLKNLGWCVNFKKSDLRPDCSKQFIGFVIDTTARKKFNFNQSTTQTNPKIKKRHKRVIITEKRDGTLYCQNMRTDSVYDESNPACKTVCLFCQANSTGRHISKVEVHVIHVAFIRGV